MPYSDTDEEYDVGVGPPMSRQVYDWYQQNASPIGDRALNQLNKGFQSFARIPQNIATGVTNALDWAGKNVAAPALGSMADVVETDWSKQPFIGSMGEHGEFTGRLPALASYLSPYLLGAAPAGPGVLPAGVKLPGGKYGYPEGYEGGYHGTHTVFSPTPENQLGQFMDKFINTGEGAQAFGYGHYVGAKKGTGANYMPSGEDMALHIGDQPWNPFRNTTASQFSQSKSGWNITAEQTAHDMLMDAPRIVTPSGHMPDVASVVEDLKGSIAELTARYNRNSAKHPVTGEYYYPQLAKENLSHLEHDKKALEFIESNQDQFKFETPGSLYHVEMKPPEESLMHWDKKLKDQEPEVLEKMKPLIEKYGVGPGREADYWMDKGGGELYAYLKRGAQEERPDLTGNGQALSEAMKEAGIPGLRFADQNSRGIFNTKQEMATTQANIDKYQKVLDQDLVPGTSHYNAIMAESGENGIQVVKNIVNEQIKNEKMDLQSFKDQLKRSSTLQIDGQPLTKPEHVPQLAKNDFAKGEALSWLFDTKDVDSAISKIKKEMEFTSESSRYERSEKAIEWLEKNRDKITLKEPDVTHNYVIFDPKDLNIIHRERNMPKGFI